MTLTEPREVKDFQEAVWHNPIVHIWMRKHLYEGIPKMVALEQSIVALVNENTKLQHMLASEIAGKPSPTP